MTRDEAWFVVRNRAMYSDSTFLLALDVLEAAGEEVFR